jgi:DNA-binding HxlR family transcriptional regulator
MQKYGQYCPVARAAEILGDKWTLLIVRDLLLGVKHFNDLERGLPGISRAILSDRLSRLAKMCIVEKRATSEGRKTTEYILTKAGRDLQSVMDDLLMWGARWAFGKPLGEELDPVLLLWWMKSGVRKDELPPYRVVMEFDFSASDKGHYWMILRPEDVSLCMQHPGFDVDMRVVANLSALYEVWLGHMELPLARSRGLVKLEAARTLERAFPSWFTWSPAAPAVKQALQEAAAA